MTSADWPAAETIVTARLILEPLRVNHAAEMAQALDDERLHEYIGGRPATLEQLQERYARQVVGRSADGAQGWLNRIVAELAWVIAAPQQGKGYASEAAAGMALWVLGHGADVLVAHIHPQHGSSMGVARRLGLTPTDVMIEGETRWTT